MEMLLNGVASDQGFLIASAHGQTFPGVLSLRTTDGTEADIELRTATGSGANVTFSATQHHIASAPTLVTVHVDAAGIAPNDTVIELLAGGQVVGQLRLSAIAQPTLHFAGRFQCRLATDTDPFDHQWGAGNSSFGSFAVSGPDVGNPDEPPLDRIVRLGEPVGLRPFAEFSPTVVTAVSAVLGASPVRFSVGDEVMGMSVRFGPQTKFESQDDDFAPAGWEPMSSFEVMIADRLRGRSADAVPRPSIFDPPGSTAPYANGVDRLDDVGPWTPSQFGYAESTWLDHATAVMQAKVQSLQGQVAASPAETRVRDRRLDEHQRNAGGILAAMTLVEKYAGLVDRDLSVDPRGSPMLAYLAACGALAFRADFFNFDTDTHCGTVAGLLADTNLGSRRAVEDRIERARR